LLIKYIKSVLWRVAQRVSYTEDARCLKVNLLRRLSIPSQVNPVHTHKRRSHVHFVTLCTDVRSVTLTISTNNFQCSVNRTVYCKQCSLRGTNLTLYTIYIHFSLQAIRWLLTELALLRSPASRHETCGKRSDNGEGLHRILPVPPTLTPMHHISHLNNKY